MLKIQVHSSVGLITNSSTEIYTDEEATVAAVKEMVEEFARVMGFSETFDQMFSTVALLNEYEYVDRIANYDLDYINTSKVIEAVIRGEIEKPEWMTKIEEDIDNDYDPYPVSKVFYLHPKDEKYQVLANKIQQFLHSPKSFAAFNY